MEKLNLILVMNKKGLFLIFNIILFVNYYLIYL